VKLLKSGKCAVSVLISDNGRSCPAAEPAFLDAQKDQQIGI
jgi:hypothetical protein